MTINTTVIYAIRILGYMCEKKNCLVRAKELVKETGISEQYCFKVMNIIRHAGLVESEQGCRGGFRMAQDPCKVSLYDVICVFEKQDSWEEKCGQDERMIGLVREIQKREKAFLKSIMIRDIYIDGQEIGKPDGL